MQETCPDPNHATERLGQIFLMVGKAWFCEACSISLESMGLVDGKLLPRRMNEGEAELYKMTGGYVSGMLGNHLTTMSGTR